MEYGEFIGELLKRSDIVRIVSRYTHLTKKGGTVLGVLSVSSRKDRFVYRFGG